MALAAPLTVIAFQPTKVALPVAVSRRLEVANGPSRLRVEFVRADIVRVQYQPDGQLTGNGTDVCVAHRKRTLSLTSAPQQYADEHPDAPYIIKVYPGADATFTIYEDAGDSYDCEHKGYVTYTLHWDDSHRQLSISARKGSYKKMVKRRQLTFVMPDGYQQTVVYDGKKAIVTLTANN